MQIPSTTEIVVLLVGVLMWLIGRRANQKQKKSAGRSAARPAAKKTPVQRQFERTASMGKLTGACFGDRAKADRLVQYEKKRAPGITHAEAIHRAFERLEIDRGRHN
ncbi:hypothetical protein [Collimonas antrihumi]|uniref:hypothetical protein n=1 Tax=Collimonas antrihumi TaxID=1940615 RepID=UPI001B8B98F4|nr:hypothetical protein [Collimonas antrihumi]